MIIKASVDFIDACDMLKCRLSRMLAIVSAAQQAAMLKNPHQFTKPHEEAAANYLADMLCAQMDVNCAVSTWRQTGGQD